MTVKEHEDKVIQVINEIGDKAKAGQKEGEITCPFCGHTLKYYLQ